MRIVARAAVGHVPVVPVAQTVVERRPVLHGLERDKVAQIPQPHALVLGVGDAVAPVALGRDVRNALGVARQAPRGFAAHQRAAVPHLEHRVVAPAHKHIRRGGVRKRHAVHVVVVRADAEHAALGLDVVHINVAVVRARDDLTRIA